MEQKKKQVQWAPGAQQALLDLPLAVRREFGHELYMLEMGEQPENASPFEGSSGANIMKLVERYDKDTYRCVYTAKLETGIYVLHAYMKKSKEGKSTPQNIIDTVHERYNAAVKIDKQKREKMTALAQKQATETVADKSNKGKAK